MNVVFCATDSGGIRNIVPILSRCTKKCIRPTLITRLAHVCMIGEYVSASADVKFTDDWSTSQLFNLFKNIKPDLIITGTTRYQSPDRQLILYGKRNSITTVSILDEWFNYRLRFLDEGTGELIFLPDAIALQDEQAREESVAEGIPEEICHITGSPALAELTKEADLMIHKGPDIPKIIEKFNDEIIVIFLSETHAEDYGTIPDSSGPLGPYLGYTEITVRQSILRVLSRINRKFVFIEKLHPSAKKENSVEYVPDNVRYLVADRSDQLWPLVWHGDLIIGMRSMGLLEAHILGCEVISFQPGLKVKDNCTAVRLGLIPKFDKECELQEWVSCKANSVKNKNRIIRHYPFAADDASEKVLTLSRQIMRN